MVVALLPIDDADRGGGRIVKRVENQMRVLFELALVAWEGDHTKGGFTGIASPMQFAETAPCAHL